MKRRTVLLFALLRIAVDRKDFAAATMLRARIAGSGR